MRRIMTMATLLVVALAACGGSGEPTATYTGGACDYDGPSEFDVDSTVTFTVINESDTTDVGFAVWKFPSGLTSEEIFSEGILQAAGPDDGGVGSITRPPTPIGEPEGLRVFLDTPGQWGINCFDLSGETETERDYMVMFTVNE